MRIAYFIRNIGVSGGVKVVLQHVKMLKEEGYDITLFTEQVKDPWDLKEMPVIMEPDNLRDLSGFDIIVASVYHDVKKLFMKGARKLVHLCQGYEPIDYLSRISGESITERYQRRGLFSAIESQLDLVKFKRRIRQIEAVYALPTYKAAVSKHLVELLEGRYGQRCALIQNGIDLNTFRPDQERTWGENGKIRVLSVGSADVGFKGIADTLDAVALLKEKGLDVELMRVSPGLPSQREKEGGLVHRYRTGLKEKEMADIYRNTDIFISSSLEGEGFGLPAIEALASGVPSILTEVSTYKNFHEDAGFAHFVPTHSPEKIAQGVEKFIHDAEFRSQCVQKGLGVAATFSLERTKEDLIRFIEGLRNDFLKN
jgi:glycosyltransferase involved in cell wall biosynthesis